MDWGYEKFWPEEKKTVYGIFFFFNPDEIWKKKSLIFFPPSRFLQRVGTRSRFVASRPLFAHWGCRLLLQGPLALVMSGPIRMKMEDKEFRLQLFFYFKFSSLSKVWWDGSARSWDSFSHFLSFFFILPCESWTNHHWLWSNIIYIILPPYLFWLMTWFVLSTYFSPL